MGVDFSNVFFFPCRQVWVLKKLWKIRHIWHLSVTRLDDENVIWDAKLQTFFVFKDFNLDLLERTSQVGLGQRNATWRSELGILVKLQSFFRIFSLEQTPGTPKSPSKKKEPCSPKLAQNVGTFWCWESKLTKCPPYLECQATLHTATRRTRAPRSMDLEIAWRSEDLLREFTTGTVGKYGM